MLLPPAQDHKRLLRRRPGPQHRRDGRLLPGAGARRRRRSAGWARRSSRRCSRTMAGAGTPFRGALYAGLMVTPQRPDGAGVQRPLRRPGGAGAGDAARRGPAAAGSTPARGARSSPRPLALLPGASVGVVLASPGYPDAPVTGARISGARPHRRQLPGVPRRHGGPRRRAGDGRRPGAHGLRPRARRWPRRGPTPTAR